MDSRSVAEGHTNEREEKNAMCYDGHGGEVEESETEIDIIWACDTKG